MKIPAITISTILFSLSMSSAIQAANFVPEEPYANFAIGQVVEDNNTSEVRAMMKTHNQAMHNSAMYWGEGADTLK